MQVGKRRKGSAYSHSLEQQVDDENGDLDDFTLMEKNDNDKRPRFSVRYLFLGAIVGLITFVLYFDVYSVREIIAGSSSFTLRGHSHLIDSSNSANSNSGSNSAVNSIGGSGSVNSNIVNSKSDSVVGDGGNHPEIPPKADQNINFEMTTDLHDKLDKELEGEVDLQLSKIRTMKQNNIVMEKDEEALFEISVLQEKLRSLLLSEYGPQPYYVEMQIEFPQSMAKVGLDQSATLLIELAPIDFVPYSVYYFIKVVENWKGGAFHRNAGHVLQATVNGRGRALAFQEYSPEYPHKKFTLGYAGRPGGPAFYISTVDNTRNHGPASQGSKTEADSCFGRLIREKDWDVVRRMQTQPGGEKGAGFIRSPKDFIQIKSMKLILAKDNTVV